MKYILNVELVFSCLKQQAAKVQTVRLLNQSQPTLNNFLTSQQDLATLGFKHLLDLFLALTVFLGRNMTFLPEVLLLVGVASV